MTISWSRQFEIELIRVRELMQTRSSYEKVWQHLKRAHILSQRSAWRHVRVHGLMLKLALSGRDWREVVGQVPRLLLAAPSSWFRFAPTGNTGRSDVPMSKSMPIPPDLQRTLALKNLRE